MKLLEYTFDYIYRNSMGTVMHREATLTAISRDPNQVLINIVGEGGHEREYTFDRDNDEFSDFEAENAEEAFKESVLDEYPFNYAESVCDKV